MADLCDILASLNVTDFGSDNTSFPSPVSALPNNLTGPQVKALWTVPLNFEAKVPKKNRDFYNKAYDDAIKLASAGIRATTPGSPVFDRYFNPDDAPFVHNVLNTWLQAATDPSGHSQMISEEVIVTIGDVDAKAHVCINRHAPVMYMEPVHPTDPWTLPGSQIRACSRFWKMTAPMDQISCDDVRESWKRMNPRMLSAGGSFLHEWLRFDYRFAPLNDIPPSTIPIDDQWKKYKGEEVGIYGPFLASLYRQFPNRVARDNADNFAWFAIEAFWTQRCAPFTFEAPIDERVQNPVDGDHPHQH